MARQTTRRPSDAETRTAVIALKPAPRGAGIRHGATRSPPGEQTIEDRLTAKADLADQMDVSGQRSLGQMTRAERRKMLFGV